VAKKKTKGHSETGEGGSHETKEKGKVKKPKKGK